jgi:hypothetical protein
MEQLIPPHVVMKFTRRLWKPKVRYRVHKSAPHDPTSLANAHVILELSRVRLLCDGTTLREGGEVKGKEEWSE